MSGNQVWVVTLTKHRSTWNYFAQNPQGGGGGSCYVGPLYIAIELAAWNIPKGESYRLVINGKERGLFRKEWDGQPRHPRPRRRKRL